MRLCLGGAGAINAPYDLNASSCYSVASVIAKPQTGTLELTSVPEMPGAAAYAVWSADPYPECALYNDAGLPASPFAIALRPTAAAVI